MKKLKLVDLYELDKKTKKELDLEEGKEYRLFEWDPDYIILQENDEVIEFSNFCEYKNKLIVDWFSSYYDELIDFCENRLENREPFEKQTREEFQKYNWLKIAYRWWIGYVYKLYYYNFNHNQK